jgi:hypothetical protein
MPTAAAKKVNGKKRHKSFEVINPDDIEPLSFDLGGEEFTCYSEVQGKAVLDVLRVTTEGDEDSRGLLLLVSTLDFFEKVMPPEEHQRLTKLMEDPQRIVSMSTMTSIMSWLIEEYSNRPTEPSSDS